MTYWNDLNTLVAESTIKIDRPKGYRHPRNKAVIYPFDYGYLDETKADVGEGIITTVDLAKRDAEIKILYGTTEEENSLALDTHNIGTQAAKLIRRNSD